LTSGAEAFKARIINLSEGGALVCCPVSLAPGSLVEVDFQLPGDNHQLRAKASVIREAPQMGRGEAAFAGVGLLFEDISEAALAGIRELVERIDPMAWDPDCPLPRSVAVGFIPVIRRQAYRIARRLPSHVCVDDLVSAGFLALVETYGRFDPTCGTAFAPYALIRIRGAMLDELRGNDPVSRGMRLRKRKVDAAAAELQHGMGRRPDEQEIADHLGLSLDDYRACLHAVTTRQHANVEELAGQSSLVPAAGPHRPAQSLPPTPELLAGESEALHRVRAAMQVLPPRLREVLDLYYGQDLTMREIGGALGLTTARISQLVSSAVLRLREDCCPESTP
jgi:RNA polymerase sigma factor for flagellar operon FliA